jgi:hypothetical protein
MCRRLAGFAVLLAGATVGGVGRQLAAQEHDYGRKSDNIPVVRSVQGGTCSADATWEGRKVPEGGSMV